jgi:hypothetical protein
VGELRLPGVRSVSGDPCYGYRTRRSWLLAEAIAGAVAITIGLISIAPQGRMAAALAKTGDTFIWLVLFCSFGAAMVLTAMVETVLRERQCPLGSACFRAFAGVREVEHIALGACYLYALATTAAMEGVLVLIPLQSAIFLIVHIRGAWEHVKAVHFVGRGADPYPSVLEFTRARLRGRDSASR